MNDNIYLELEIRKSNGKTDDFGNYIFYYNKIIYEDI